MKRLTLLWLVLIMVSCHKTNYDLEQINGYWEIVEAQTPYGTKQYKMSKSVDYFYLESDSTGLRKKVQPSLLGKHKITESNENFTFITKNDSLKIKFSSPYDAWTEDVLELTENKLVLKNNQSIIYTYKRFEPLEVEQK